MSVLTSLPLVPSKIVPVNTSAMAIYSWVLYFSSKAKYPSAAIESNAAPLHIALTKPISSRSYVLFSKNTINMYDSTATTNKINLSLF